MTTVESCGGGFDVDRLLSFEKRSGIKDGEIETFITKVDAVNAAIRDMKDGKLDPADVHVDGIPTIEEERQAEEDKRAKRLDLFRRESENREKQKREEEEKWWRGAEVLYGERKQLSATEDLKGSRDSRGTGGNSPSKSPISRETLSEEDRIHLKDRYSLEYSRWDTWTPSDPATLAEIEECEEAKEEINSKAFEESNPEFCEKMVDDMKARAQASDKRESEATTARLKGNRFYKTKRWGEAFEQYMASLRASPYTVNTLANAAQALIKLGRWSEAAEFCDRALHVDDKSVKALSRRALVFTKLAGEYPTLTEINHGAAAVATPPSSLRENVKGAGVIAGDTVILDKSIERVPREEDEALTSAAENSGNVNRIRSAFHKRFGGKEGLLALALVDLNAAVDIDHTGEDIRRQRDTLRTDINEAKAEANIMKKARNLLVNYSTANSARKVLRQGGVRGASVEESVMKDSLDVEGGLFSAIRILTSSDENNLAETSATARSAEMKKREPSIKSVHSLKARQDGYDMQVVDRLLEAILGNGEMHTGTLEKTLPPRPLLLLRDTLERNPTVRVYFRASGGLARLAKATAAGAVRAATGGCQNEYSNSRPSRNDIYSLAGISPVSLEYTVNAGHAPTSGFDGFGVGDTSQDHPKKQGAFIAGSKSWCSFELMLRAIAAALVGGERVAQQDVLQSGLLDGPCSRALQMPFKVDAREDVTRIAEGGGIAGAAALVLRRVVDNTTVRGHMARDISLLSGLIGLTSSGSNPPVDIEAAAQTLSNIFLGRTALAATKTLQNATTESNSTGGPDGRVATVKLPAMGIGKVLLAWKDGSGLMKGAPPSTGAALCGLLANLAMREEFRGTFVDPFPYLLATKGDKGVDTVVAVLVLVAGDNKIERAEAKALALAALVNACLHNDRVQAVTLSAGGLALALAMLSLEKNERARYGPPVVAARSAMLLARLSSLPLALEAMARPDIIKIIMMATVRSATLGGNIYNIVSKTNKCKEVVDSATASAADATAAHATERENLVRTLASILRSNAVVFAAGPNKIGLAAPFPHIPVQNIATETKISIWALAQKLGLAEALVSFLPPAREDGVEGVTTESVALRPAWCAPTAVAGNICSCLLHLLGGNSLVLAEKVVEQGGIPRLISLFANLEWGGAGISCRKNVAICLAKLAREPRYKQVITKLRGMEMLIQAGTGLVV